MNSKQIFKSKESGKKWFILNNLPNQVDDLLLTFQQMIAFHLTKNICGNQVLFVYYYSHIFTKKFIFIFIKGQTVLHK